MQGSAALWFGAAMLGVFILLAAVMLLQEARFNPAEEPPEYILLDAVRFVSDRVDPAVRQRIGRSGVQRVLEWQVRFLQDLAKSDKEVPIVLGNTQGTVDYVVAQLASEGHTFSPGDVAACLELQGDYLVGVGAVGSEAPNVFVEGTDVEN